MNRVDGRFSEGPLKIFHLMGTFSKLEKYRHMYIPQNREVYLLITGVGASGIVNVSHFRHCESI